MINNEEDKSLRIVKEQSIFQKIKTFFKRFFGKEDNSLNTVAVQNTEENIVPTNTRTSFSERIKIVEDEETKLLKLQKQYRSGQIKEKDMSREYRKSCVNKSFRDKIKNIKEGFFYG